MENVPGSTAWLMTPFADPSVSQDREYEEFEVDPRNPRAYTMKTCGGVPAALIVGGYALHPELRHRGT